MEAFENHDARCVQVCSYTQTNIEGEACHDAIVRIKAFEDANKIFGKAVEKNQHENYECYISKSST